MIKRTITYFDDVAEEQRTEDFYFHISKLDALRLEAQFEGGVQGHLNRIAQAEDAKEAFKLFEDVVLSAYGKKFPDGKFYKKDPRTGIEYRYEFEASPALGELIIGFLQNVDDATAFLEGCLPANLVAEAKAEAAQPVQMPQVGTETVELPTAPAQLEPAAKTFEQYSRDELLAMSNDEFNALVPVKAQDMTQDQLVIAMQRKNQVPTGA